MSELKPCPFCGGKAIFLENDDGRVLPWLICSGCSCETGCYDTIEEAIAAWNRRASGWISVKERLPDKDGRYMCVVDAKYYPVRPMDFYAKPDFWDEEDDRWSESYGIFARKGFVKYWMPLPDAPEVPE